MSQCIGQLQVDQGIPIYSGSKILVVMVELSEVSVMKIHHRGDAVETEAVNMKLFYPILDIREQELQHFGFTVVEELRVPCAVVSPTSGVKILVVRTIKLIQALGDIFHSVRVHQVDDNGNAHIVGRVDQGF